MAQPNGYHAIAVNPQRTNALRLLKKQAPTMIVLSLSAAALRKVDQYTQYDNLMWAWAQLQSTWTISTGVLLAFAALFLAVVVRLMIPSKRKVYLLDFAVHKPAER